ncbi:hypothetical protein, partial [Telmatospirillum sp.]|uniref:hypothetical protein n=1 Tax=Telmatospirillum sp. TaxID=2079197 RepID=UPI00284981A8
GGIGESVEKGEKFMRIRLVSHAKFSLSPGPSRGSTNHSKRLSCNRFQTDRQTGPVGDRAARPNGRPQTATDQKYYYVSIT